MSKYRLKKDLPGLKAGLTSNEKGEWHTFEDGEFVHDVNENEIHLFPDWFEEIRESETAELPPNIPARMKIYHEEVLHHLHQIRRHLGNADGEKKYTERDMEDCWLARDKFSGDQTYFRIAFKNYLQSLNK